MSFLIFNNSSPPHKSKSNNLKYCPNSEFFSIEVIEITSNISSAETRVDLGYFVLKFVLNVKMLKIVSISDNTIWRYKFKPWS